MLDEATNTKFMQTGAGTPMGELLRRHWHPIAAVPESPDRSQFRSQRSDESVHRRAGRIGHDNLYGAFGILLCHRLANKTSGHGKRRDDSPVFYFHCVAFGNSIFHGREVQTA